MAADQYIGEMYRDPIVQMGLSVLERLDDARTNDLMFDEMSAVTAIHKFPDPYKEYWESTTTYRAQIVDNISPDILRQPLPPHYLQDMLGNLVVAHVYHENQKMSGSIPLFSPNSEELAAHVLMMWETIPDRIKKTPSETPYMLPIHKIKNTTLELFKQPESNTWSLDFTHAVTTLRMIAITNPAYACWIEGEEVS